ncbi:hypothetical protein [Arthrobacter woluwensis]|uniref:hypothetical protein n=1 Tax=Arthrobacter woluwensis TaxID=156980 RepID=UPI0037F6D036
MPGTTSTAKTIEERENERIRNVLKEAAPDFRDAVVRGFAVENDDLKRVATPELLDDIAGNVLALRLGDRHFAEEVYADIRDQAIRAPERWHDVQVFIRLSSIDERNTGGVPRFVVTVTWEYTTIPSHIVQRFACVSDREEFRELISDTPATFAWRMAPRPGGFDAASKDAFELVQYSINGEERTIRRTQKKGGQTYSVTLGRETVATAEPSRISYTYRTIVPPDGHLLHFDIDQPTKGLQVNFDYSDTDIAQVKVLDLIASSKHARIQRMPSSVPGKSVSVDFDGWVFPRTGIAFVWTLGSEAEG